MLTNETKIINDRYIKDKFIGGGKESAVWLVLDKADNRHLALKYLSNRTLNSPPQVSQFKNEFKILSSLHHKNITKAYDFGYDSIQKSHYYTSEYIKGKDIYNAAYDKDFVSKEKLLIQVLNALEYIHDRGIIHYDIKCENILVDNNAEVKIVDFGLSHKSSRTRLGTLAYMAPELIISDSTADHRIDLYSLGMVLFRIFLNRWPFKEVEPSKILKWHLQEGISFTQSEKEKIPDYIQDLIIKLLTKNPSDRFSSARIAANYIDLHSRNKYKRKPQTQAFPYGGSLAGRDKTLKEIYHQLEEINQKKSSPHTLNLIVADKGMGKSRLLEEIKFKAQLMEIPTCQLALQSTTDPLDVLIPFFDLPKNIEEKESFLKLAVDKILTTTKNCPKLLLVDDIHKTSKTIIDLLSGIINRQAFKKHDSSLMIIAACPKDYRLPISPYVTKNYQYLLKTFSLDPLNTQHIQQFLEATVGKPGKDLVKKLHLLTSGNPLLLTEYLNAYGENLLEKKDLAPPKDLTDLYSPKIHSLTPQEKRILNVIAIYNKSVTVNELELILNLDSNTIFLVLRKLLHLGLLQTNAREKNYSVKNLTLAKITLDSVSKKERIPCHEKIASIIEKKDKKQVSELAFHYTRSNNKEKALHYLMEDAERCTQQWDIPRAIESYQKALKLSKTSHIKNEITRKLAKLKVSTGKIDEGIKLLKETLTKTVRDEKVKDLRFIGNCYLKKGDFHNSSKAYERALKLKPKSKSSQINIINDLACLKLQKGDYQESIQLFKKAQRLAKKIENRYLPNNRLGLAYSQTGLFKEAKTFYNKKIDILAKDNTSKSPLISCFMDYAYILNTNGYFKESEKLFKESLKLSLKNHYLFELPTILNSLINVTINQASYGEALSYINTLQEYQATIGTIRDLAHSYLSSGACYTIINQRELAKTDLDEAKKLFEHLKDEEGKNWVLLSTGYILRNEQEFNGSNTIFAKIAKSKNKKLAHLATYALADNKLMQRKLKEAKKLYKKSISLLPAPDEPQLNPRLKLLNLKLSAISSKDDPNLISELTNLCSELMENEQKELEWEAFFTLGQYLINQNKPNEAIYFIKTSINVLEDIMKNLPEEFRDKYKNEPYRREVYKRLQQIQKKTPSKNREVLSTERRDVAIENLLAINKRISSELNLEVLLKDILDFALQLSGAERCYLLLGDRKDNMKIKIARNIEEDEAMRDFSRSIALKAIRSGNILVTLDASSDPEFKGLESVQSFELKSIVCIPLIVKNQAIGVIYLDNRQRITQLTEVDLKLLQEFGNHAAIALENAKVVEHTKTQQEKLLKKLNEARKTISLNNKKFREAKEEIDELKTEWNTKYSYKNIVGQSPTMQDTLKLIDKITPYNSPVFIYGETGTGKELMAKALHTNGPRSQKRFVAINCASFPRDILESEIFGYQKGAFTGAINEKKGLFEVADGGTLFLDEITSMSLDTQAKILRVLQEQEFYRLGGTSPIKIDIRVISASNQNIKEYVHNDKFRQDLYYRICGLKIEIPPLRERKTDLPLLIQHFIEKYKDENKIDAEIKVDPDAVKVLLEHNWPGNVRQLEHCVNNAIITSSNHTITKKDILPFLDIESQGDRYKTSDYISINPEKPFEEYEIEIIKKTLAHFNGNRVHTARHLKISRTALINKIRRAGIEKR